MRTQNKKASTYLLKEAVVAVLLWWYK